MTLRSRKRGSRHSRRRSKVDRIRGQLADARAKLAKLENTIASKRGDDLLWARQSIADLKRRIRLLAGRARK